MHVFSVPRGKLIMNRNVGFHSSLFHGEKHLLLSLTIIHAIVQFCTLQRKIFRVENDKKTELLQFDGRRKQL